MDPRGLAIPAKCQNCDGLSTLDEHGEPINLDYVEYLKDECDEQ